MKKQVHSILTLLPVLMLLLLTPVSARADILSVDEAFSLVKAQVAETDANYYLCEGDNVPESVWQFFVDAEPTKAWAHDCYVIKIPKDSGSNDKLEKQKLSCPPTKVELKPYKVKKPVMKAAAVARKTFTAGLDSTLNIKRQGRIFALIVNGGGNKETNNERHWNDCAYLYQTLRTTYKVPQENIEVLISDGFNPFPDMVDVDDESMNSETDLDGDGEDDVTGAATSEEIAAAIDRIKERIGKDDLFLLFLTGPSELDVATSSDVKVYLWNEVEDQSLSDGPCLKKEDLHKLLSPILDVDCLKFFVLAYGFSGNYPAEFKRNDVVVTTACNKKQQMSEEPQLPYYGFGYRWISALNRVKPDGTNTGSDYDGDGYISAYEAFNNVYATRKVKDNPQYYAASAQMFKMLNLDYVMSSNELYIADNVEQTKGWNSLSTSEYAWNSPDISITNSSDSTYNEIIIGKTAYIKVRVRNASWRPSPIQKLNVGWFFNSIGLNRRIMQGFDKDDKTPLGGLISSIEIPSIKPFSSEEFLVKWQVPVGVTLALVNEKSPYKSIGAYARVYASGTTSEISRPTTENVYNHIASDRTFAASNVLVLSPYIKNRYVASMSAYFPIRNFKSSSEKYTFQAYGDTYGDDYDAYIDRISEHAIDICMPIQYYQKWLESGGTTTCPVYTDTEYAHFDFVSQDKIEGLYLDSLSAVNFNIHVTHTHQYETETPRMCQMDFVLKDSTGDIYDGITINAATVNYMLPLSISESREQEIQCFVDKTGMHKGDRLYVKLLREADVNTIISISDAATAQLVSIHALTAGDMVSEIDLNSLQKGIYVVNLLVDGYAVDSIKIRVD